MSLISRFKLAFVALFGITLLAAQPAQSAGTIPLAMAQQVDVNGQPLANCIVNFFVAGTVASPQNSYSDFALTQNPNNQLRCDQTGRVPMFWLADGLIHVRMTDANGTPIIDTTMQVLGPSSGGGGGGGTVDPTTIAATGDLKARYDTGLIAGWVRSNGLTIGNATSGATERANADTQNLFIYLYNKDPNLVVSGGRTGNALNDYNANKTIATPDWRGQALAFLDDMGNTPAGRLTSTYFGTAPTVLGAASTFLESRTVVTANLPPYTPSGSVTVSSTVADIMRSTTGLTDNYSSIGGICCFINQVRTSITSTGSLAGATQGGTSTPLSIVQPTRLATLYLKL